MKILSVYSDKINGVISSFDRIIINGYLLNLQNSRQFLPILFKIMYSLSTLLLLLRKKTKALCDHIEQFTLDNNAELHYLYSSKTSKIEYQIVDEYIKTMNEEVLESYQSLEGKRILLAEDNELNAEIAQVILEGCGISVDWVNDGIECVGKVIQKSSNTYDLILMDIQMSIMDGYMATKKIRELPDKNKANIPIIAMMPMLLKKIKKALEAGMKGHISKPMDVDKLKHEITLIISKK